MLIRRLLSPVPSGDIQKVSPCASPLTAEEEVLPDEEQVELHESLISRTDASNEDEIHEEPMLTEEPVEEQEIAFIVDI